MVAISALQWSSGVALAAIVLTHLQPANASISSGGPFSGHGLYSNNGGSGVCQGSSGAGLTSIAINAAQFQGGDACGSCVQVTASGAGAGKNPYPSSFTAVINNICPSGNYGDLDLPENKDGRWDISWSFVECPGSSASGGRKLMGHSG